MSTATKIEWTEATWNPVTGCTKVSPGCDICYAERIHERFNGEGSFASIVYHEKKLWDPLRWRKPRRVFVNSMSDLFHDNVSDEFIAKVFAVMALAQRHTFQLLTKRHGRMRSLLSNPDFQVHVALAALEFNDAILSCPWPLRNVWLGVSVENQKWADVRIPALLETPATVRWLSCEPLLGELDLTRVKWGGHFGNGSITHLDVVNGFYGMPGVWKEKAKRIDWVVVGGESGHGARPMHPDWARDLRDQCTAASVPFFFKQWGEWQDGSHDPRFQRGPDHVILEDGRHVLFSSYADSDLVKGDPALRHRACVISRVGKKSAGRLLDGREWNEYPS